MIESEPKEFWDDMRWGKDHYAELVRKYPDKWVAIVDENIVVFGDSIKKVEEEARKATGKRNEQIAVIYVECGAHVY